MQQIAEGIDDAADESVFRDGLHLLHEGLPDARGRRA